MNNKGERFPAEVLPRRELMDLMEACPTETPVSLRNQALIVVLHRAGLRISEALDLRPKDLDAHAGTLRVLHSKGDKARTVGMDAKAFKLVARWIKARTKLGITNIHAPLFCTAKGGRIHTAYIRAMMPRLARKAGITKRVHAHGLRHTHAATLAANGLPINVIQKQLGHGNAAITSLYLDHVAPADVVSAVRGIRWGSGK